jgi:hypothetical protein
MSKEKNRTYHILDELERDGKRFYHILEFSHEEIDDMLTRLNEGGVLTQEERDFLNKNKLTKFSTFSGSYEDLYDKPVIPKKLDDLKDKKRITDLENIANMHDNEFTEVYNKLDTKLDSDRIQIAPEGGLNFFFGSLLDEVVNIGRPIDYNSLSIEDYKILSRNINKVSSKCPEYDSELGFVFCNGTLAVIEEVPGQDLLTVSWVDKEKKSIEVPSGIDIFAGGNGLEEPANFPATGLIIKSGELKNVYGGSLGTGNVAYTNILMSGGSVLTMTGGGQSVYKMKYHDNHVGKNHFVLNGGTVETMFLGSQGSGIVNHTILNMNDGLINDFTAGGENGTTLLTELHLNGGEIKFVQGINRGHVGCITYNLTAGKIETFYAGGRPNVGSVDGKYDHCRVFIDGTEFVYNPEPGTNDRIREDARFISGSILKKYSENLKINTNNIKKLNLITKDYIEGKDISKIETEYEELIVELSKLDNKYNLEKKGHKHTSEDMTDFVEAVQGLIENKLVAIDLDKYAVKAEVAASFESVNNLIDTLMADVIALKGEDSKLNTAISNITTRINRMESDISDLETAVNYRTTNEDIEEIMANLVHDIMTLEEDDETGK